MRFALFAFANECSDSPDTFGFKVPESAYPFGVESPKPLVRQYRTLFHIQVEYPLICALYFNRSIRNILHRVQGC